MPLTLSLESLDRRLQRKLVPLCSETRDDPNGDITKIGVLAEFLPRMHVRQMHFDERDADAEDRIPERHARVRESARINHNAANLIGLGLMNPVD